jgi:hypothetical protein
MKNKLYDKIRYLHHAKNTHQNTHPEKCRFKIILQYLWLGNSEHTGNIKVKLLLKTATRNNSKNA